MFTPPPVTSCLHVHILYEKVYYLDTNINHNKTRLLFRTCYNDGWFTSQPECTNGDAPDGWSTAKMISDTAHTEGTEGWSEYKCRSMIDDSKPFEKWICTYEFDAKYFADDL